MRSISTEICLLFFHLVDNVLSFGCGQSPFLTIPKSILIKRLTLLISPIKVCSAFCLLVAQQVISKIIPSPVTYPRRSSFTIISEQPNKQHKILNFFHTVLKYCILELMRAAEVSLVCYLLFCWVATVHWFSHCDSVQNKFLGMQLEAPEMFLSLSKASA